MTANKDWIYGDALPGALTYTELHAAMPHKDWLHMLADAEWDDSGDPRIAGLGIGLETRARLIAKGLGPPGPWKRPPKE